ncbi:MAG: hypothetical protein AAF670_00685 [Planctomycetota bacterium]
MDDRSDDLLVLAASRMKGAFRRTFQAEVCLELCDGSPRQAEQRFGWARDTVAKDLAERKLDPEQLAKVKSNNRGRQRSEDSNPQLAIDIRLIVEPHTQSDPELKTERSYTNLPAKEVRQALLNRGCQHDELPSERTLRDILNRMNYRLKRIQKGKPLKKTEHTDAIFENVQAAKRESEDDPETLEISIDVKTKVKLGEFSLRGKKPDHVRR